MHEVIVKVDAHRLVTIKGVPGIGKTSLARSVGNFLLDRHVFRDGVVYVSLRGCESAQMLVFRLQQVLFKKK